MAELIDTKTQDAYGVWHSIQLLTKRQDFPSLAKSIIKSVLVIANNDDILRLRLKRSKVFILGDVRGERKQLILFVERDSPAFRKLESENYDILTNLDIKVEIQ